MNETLQTVLICLSLFVLFQILDYYILQPVRSRRNNDLGKTFISAIQDSNDIELHPVVISLRREIAELEKRVLQRDIRIEELRTEIRRMGEDRERRQQEWDRLTDFMQKRIDALEEEIKKKLTNTAIPTPVTVLVTVDSDIQKFDEIALNKANILYRRIANATRDKIEDEFRRRRSGDTMYPFVIFSAHMNELSIPMTTGPVLDAYWLNVNLAGAKLVILNGCKSTKLADSIVGVVDYVLSMTEDIPDTPAGNFLYVFFNILRTNESVSVAFARAKMAEPVVAPFVDLQIKTGIKE